MDDRLPLDGVKVLDLAWVVAGPLVGRTLADFGATVVRVEAPNRVDTARMIGPFPGGVADPERGSCYGNANAGKLGLALDISVPAAKEVLADLVAWADVLVESFAPGVLSRWGFDRQRIESLSPSIVMLSSSLLGQTGPHALYAGYGNVGAALAGFTALVGWPGMSPSGQYGPYTDCIAPRFALAALLAALDRRRRTGEGCFIDLSQVEASLQFLAGAVAAYSATGEAVVPRGNRDPEMVPHGVYPCLPRRAPDDAPPDVDVDEWVAIAVADDSQWIELVDEMGRPGWALDARYATAAGRRAEEDELDQRIAAWTSTEIAVSIERRLQERGVAAHVASSSDDACADPQLVARGHFVTVPHPLSGTTVVEGPRMRLSRTPGAVVRAAPTLGEHSEHVLVDLLGYPEGRVAELRQEGALG